MAWQIPAVGTTATVSLGAADSLWVARPIVLSGGVTASGTVDQRILVDGIIASNSIAVQFTASSNTTNSMTINAGGVVRSFLDSGMQIGNWGFTLSNAGVIDGKYQSIVFMGGTPANLQTVTNSGTISSDGIAIARYGGGGADSKLVVNNSGTLKGGVFAIGVTEGGYATGEIDAVDLITNTGKIIGGVQLSGGNDTYLGASGRLTGLVLGGTGNDKIFGGIDGNEFRGGTGNDTLTGNGGNDTLKGDAGLDKLNGGLGRDTLTGGDDADLFIFSAGTHSVVGTNADLITDFDDRNSTGDRIDLSALFGPALQYIHNAAFTTAGQVRINDIAGPDVVVEVNLTGTSGADFSIRLAGTTLASMNGGDFVL